MKKLLLFIILLPTILMADAVIFSGNDVKALKQNLDLFGVVKVMSGALDPSAGGGVAAPQGSAYLSTVHGLFLKTGVANTAWTKNSLLPVDLTSQVTGVLPIANGGTGSATQNFVDLTTSQTIGGTKTFSSTIQGDISGNSATVTTNANLTGDVTSIGNTTSYNNVVPVAKGGTGSATQNFVDLTTNQTVAGDKTWTGTHTFNNTISGSITGNAATVTTNANLTGAVTSVGNATSLGSFTSSNLATALADETGTGAAVFATSPTLTTPNIGAATGTSLELSGAFNSSLISAINMLPNGNVELTDISMFTVGSGNAKARTTTSGEFSSNTAALKITTTAATLDVSQSVSTPSGIQKQGFLRIIYRIPSAVTDAQICTLVDAAEQTCVPSSRLLNNGLFNSIEVPLVFGSTSVGWKAKTTAPNSQDFFFDGVVVGQGLGLQNLQGDTLYSATVSNAGAITQESKSGWLTSCSWSPTGTLTCNFATGTFTVTPNCWAGSTNAEMGLLGAPSTSSVQFFGQTSAGSAGNATRTVVTCQRQGSDYLAASANVYSQANADFGGTPVTYTLTNAGTATVTGTVARQGDLGIFKGRINIGATPPSGAITLNLPSGYVLSNTTNFTGGSVVGLSAGSYYTARAYPSSSTSVQFYGSASAVWSTTVPGTWTSAGSNYIDFEIIAQISGWASSPAIVGSFEGVPSTPSYKGRIDTFKVSYAANSSFNSACTTGTCTIDQSGTSEVSAIRFTGAGAYAIDVNKTYLKFFCTGSTLGATYTNLGSVRCTNCNTLAFYTGSGSTATNTYGTLECTGTY